MMPRLPPECPNSLDGVKAPPTVEILLTLCNTVNVNTLMNHEKSVSFVFFSWGGVQSFIHG